MFEGLKKSLGKVLSNLSKTELRATKLDPILWDFKLALLRNDVALSVTDKICDEVKRDLNGVEVKRFSNKGKIVENSLREIICNILRQERRFDLLDLAAEKKQKEEPLISVFIGINGTGKCVHGDTSIQLADGQAISIKEIYDEVSLEHGERRIGDGFIVKNPGIEVFSVDLDSLKIKPKSVTMAWKLKAPSNLIKLTLENGLTIETTPEHPFFTLKNRGIITVRTAALEVDDYVMAPTRLPKNYTIVDNIIPNSSKRALNDESIPYIGSTVKLIRRAQKLVIEDVAREIETSRKSVSMYEEGKLPIPKRELAEFLRLVSKTGFDNTILYNEFNYLLKLAFSDACWLKVKEVERTNSPSCVYDLTVCDYHNFVANNLIVHNTTSIAKVAHLLLKKDYSVVLAGSDTYRAGAIEQLEGHGRHLGVRVIKHDYSSDAAAVAFDAISHAQSHGINVVLIDTAGRMQTDLNLLNEMKKIIRVSKPDLVILVVDALTGNDAVEQSSVFNEEIGIDGVILTKVDADAKGGAAISIKYVTGKPILYLGTGQQYGDLTPFSPDYVLAKIFE